MIKFPNSFFNYMKETFYFSHDYNARNDEKIVKLIQKEGWEGYGLYWAIIEKLYEADGFLDEDYDCIAFDLRTECERITSIIKDYKLFSISMKKISSKSCLARLRKRKGKSESARQSANIRWNKLNNDDANAMRTQSERNAIKESKGKENKVKESKSRETLLSQLEAFKEEYSPSLLEDFENYWGEKDSKGKQRWKKEKTWDISRRLKKWKKTQEKWDWERSQRQQLKKVDEMPVKRENKNVVKDEGFQSIGNIINK